MRLRVLLFISVVVLSVGKQANGREPALPDELTKAKTLCLDVQLVALHGDESLKVKATALEALKKWGRFAVAPNCGSADVVLYVTSQELHRGHKSAGDGVLVIENSRRPSVVVLLGFTVIGQRSGQTLYSTQTDDCSSVSGCVKAEIKTLRKIMESKAGRPG